MNRTLLQMTKDNTLNLKIKTTTKSFQKLKKKRKKLRYFNIESPFNFFASIPVIQMQQRG